MIQFDDHAFQLDWFNHQLLAVLSITPWDPCICIYLHLVDLQMDPMGFGLNGILLQDHDHGLKSHYGYSNRSYIFEWLYFHCHVSFSGNLCVQGDIPSLLTYDWKNPTLLPIEEVAFFSPRCLYSLYSSIPRHSMDGIFYHKKQPNVGKYTIHWVFGIVHLRFWNKQI